MWDKHRLCTLNLSPDDDGYFHLSDTCSSSALVPALGWQPSKSFHSIYPASAPQLALGQLHRNATAANVFFMPRKINQTARRAKTAKKANTRVPCHPILFSFQNFAFLRLFAHLRLSPLPHKTINIAEIVLQPEKPPIITKKAERVRLGTRKMEEHGSGQRPKSTPGQTKARKEHTRMAMDEGQEGGEMM